MIPEGFITQLLDRADIVDVIGRAVPLKKAGRNYQACCPFHKEKTPSFSVSPDKQIYKCFGCGAAGNAIGFIKEYEGLEFPDAVRRLAGMYQMVVPEDNTPRRREAQQKVKTLTEYMDDAATFYRGELLGTPRVMQYVRDRRLTDETCERFRLGYSPDEWHALQAVFGEKYSAPELKECGLVNEKGSRRYDAYRGRLMFPIRNPKGQVIGFGARTLNGDEQPKYLNSPETSIYHKGRELYGLYEGRDAIRHKGRAIVCEGYMDVIQLSQAGFEESVAALGTSITPEHVQKLFKLSDRVYFSFDGDTAGRKAAVRALEATLPVITDTQMAGFILLPPEHDPDSLIKEKGAPAFEEAIQSSLRLTTFMMECLTRDKDLSFAEERAQVVANGKPWARAMAKAPILRLSLIKAIAEVARLEPDAIEREYGLAQASSAQAVVASMRQRQRERFGGFTRPNATLARTTVVKDLRRRLLQCLLVYPQLCEEFDERIRETFLTSEHPLSLAIKEVWRTALNERGRLARASAATVLQALEGSVYFTDYEVLLNEELQTETTLSAARLELKSTFLELELEHVKDQIKTLVAAPVLDAAQFQRMNKRRQDLMTLLAQSKTEECDFRTAEISQSQVTKERETKPMKLDRNPAVRALQEYLLQGGAAGARLRANDEAAQEEAPTPEPTPERPRDVIRAALSVVESAKPQPVSAPAEDPFESLTTEPDAAWSAPEMDSEAYLATLDGLDDQLPDDAYGALAVDWADDVEVGMEPDLSLYDGIDR